MEELFYFVCVNFVYDPKLPYFPFWYACNYEEAKVGDWVVAPLGNHNRLQDGIIIETKYTTADKAPFPLDRIKCIKELKSESQAYRIVRKKQLNPTVTMMDIYAPLVAKKAQAGQFIILRVDDDGERIPLTVAGVDTVRGTVKIIFQIVGGTTIRLNEKQEGEFLSDFVGPLGCATRTEGVKKVCIVGGGVGCAIALPVAQKFHELGAEVHSIIGFRNKDLLILEDEFKACSDELTIMTDDGSYGRQGVVTVPLKDAIEAGEDYDEVIAIGPLIMMKFVVETTKPYGIPTTVSMNPIMIDGTGMCGGCRLTVGGKTKFACVDGPDFNGFEVDFDEAMARSSMYAEFEKRKRDATCNLFKKETI